MKSAALSYGASAAVVCTHYKDGGKGAMQLANAIVELTSSTNKQKEKVGEVKWLYELSDSLETKILKLAKKVYHFNGVVEWSEEAAVKRDYLDSNVNPTPSN